MHYNLKHKRVLLLICKWKRRLVVPLLASLLLVWYPSASSDSLPAQTKALSLNIEQIVPPVGRPDYDNVLAALHQSQEATQTSCEAAGGTLNGLTCKIPPKVAPVGTYANNYAAGNCTAYVASRVPVPNSMGNATSWQYGLASAGWHIVAVPVVGNIGVSHAGYFGHVVVVVGISGDVVTISEMNFVGFNLVDNRNVGIDEFVWLSK